jgi:asparagine synthase (glutamine-hydrolysing)
MGVLEPVEQFMAYDLAMALPGDMLVKVDRASMAHSLEARVPFLDHDFVELALQVPLSLKTDGRMGKLILRRMLSKRAPEGWMDDPQSRRKKGFGVPIGRWLRGELRDWAESILSERALGDNPWLDSVAVQKRWREFLKGAAWEHPMWSVLMLQAWLDEYRGAISIE